MTHTEMLEEARKIDSGKPLQVESEGSLQSEKSAPIKRGLARLADSNLAPALLITVGATWLALNRARSLNPNLIPQVEERVLEMKDSAKSGLSHLSEAAHENFDMAKESLVGQAKRIATEAKTLVR